MKANFSTLEYLVKSSEMGYIRSLQKFPTLGVFKND